MVREDWAAARAEGQRKRIIALLEQLADAESKAQCRMCGEWYDNLPAHERHCNGP
jgi:hypothetical protein